MNKEDCEHVWMLITTKEYEEMYAPDEGPADVRACPVCGLIEYNHRKGDGEWVFFNEGNLPVDRKTGYIRAMLRLMRSIEENSEQWGHPAHKASLERRVKFGRGKTKKSDRRQV